VGDPRAVGRALGDVWLIEHVRAIWTQHREVYGAPRIHAELRIAHGVRVGRKRVERLMREAGIFGASAPHARPHHGLGTRRPGRRRSG
jgi:putative transposase